MIRRCGCEETDGGVWAKVGCPHHDPEAKLSRRIIRSVQGGVGALLFLPAEPSVAEDPHLFVVELADFVVDALLLLDRIW